MKANCQKQRLYRSVEQHRTDETQNISFNPDFIDFATCDISAKRRLLAVAFSVKLDSLLLLSSTFMHWFNELRA